MVDCSSPNNAGARDLSDLLGCVEVEVDEAPFLIPFFDLHSVATLEGSQTNERQNCLAYQKSNKGQKSMSAIEIFSYTSTLTKTINHYHGFRYSNWIHLGVDICLQGVILVRNPAIYTNGCNVTVYQDTLFDSLYLIVCKGGLCVYATGLK
jgi:hypothetical protein